MEMMAKFAGPTADACANERDCAATAGNIAAGADLTLVALIQPVRS